jgi:hypothetical protein
MLKKQVDIRAMGCLVAGAEEMGQAKGGADKAVVGVVDLEALSNERPMAEEEECRMVDTHRGPAPDGRRPPTTLVTQKYPRHYEPVPKPFQWITCAPRVAQGWEHLL